MKTIQLTDSQYNYLMHCLEQLQRNMASNSCNDLTCNVKEIFSKEEQEQIAKEFAFYNNPSEPNGPDWPLPDYCLLFWLIQKLQHKPSTSKVFSSEKEYYDKHQHCPNCGNIKMSSTYVGYIFSENYPFNDENIRKCSCGWSGTTNDLNNKNI